MKYVCDCVLKINHLNKYPKECRNQNSQRRTNQRRTNQRRTNQRRTNQRRSNKRKSDNQESGKRESDKRESDKRESDKKIKLHPVIVQMAHEDRKVRRVCFVLVSASYFCN